MSLSDEIAEGERPPIALDVFIVQMGISRRTAWAWRKKGILRTINIYGRVYIPAREITEFNRRAAAGEFAKEHQTPTTRSAPAKPNRRRAA